MTPGTLQDVRALLAVPNYLPSISIIMPFEPKMSLKAELAHKLKLTYQQVEREINGTYSEEKALPVLEKLEKVLKTLDYNTYKKSIAIYVSPLLEKVFYLDIPVEEKVIIDGSFEIRDLVYSKKEMHKYLVLVLSSERSRIFLGNTVHFIRISSNVPEHVAAYTNDIPERVSNFSDPSHRKEVLMEKFLRHIDDGLGILLQAYPFPLFVMGTERVLGHFNKLTHNRQRVIGYVHGNFESVSEAAIREALAPHIADWQKVKAEDLRRQLEEAGNAKKLAVGIESVWKEAMQKKGRLLVVEKNYMFPARLVSPNRITSENEPETHPFHIKDAVDDVIEKVLENGGDVEFVDEGILKDYAEIALVGYY